MSDSDSDDENPRKRSTSYRSRKRKGLGRKKHRYDPSMIGAAVRFENIAGDQVDVPHRAEEAVDHQNTVAERSGIPLMDDETVSDLEGNDAELVIECTHALQEQPVLSSDLQLSGQEDLAAEDNDAHSSDSDWSNQLENERIDSGAEAGDSDYENDEGCDRNAIPFEVVGEDEDFMPRDDDDDGENDELENESGNFNFNQASLDQPLMIATNRSVREALLLDLALMVRHKWTYESLLDNFKAKNALFGQKYFPTSKTELWRTLGRNRAGIVTHVYCDCGSYIGRKSMLPAQVQCVCETMINIAKAKVFVTLSLRKQLEAFLSDLEVQQLFKKARRTPLDDDVIGDIYDGKLCKECRDRWGEFDGSYICNTDGCKIGKNAQTTIYPFFIRINEIPPHLRQKYVFLGGIYCGKGEPHMQAFLKPIVKELNALAKDGVKWHDQEDGVERITKFRFHCFCVDGKARYQILNMSGHTSYYGCTVCDFKGVRIDQTMRYPNKPHEAIPPYQERTHEGMIRDMRNSSPQMSVRGHHGFTNLVLLDNVDLVKQGGFDDLHFLYECAAATNLELMISVAPRVKDGNKEISVAAVERALNARLETIKTPSKISRKPCNMKIKRGKNKHVKFTGTEYRNFLIYYGVPLFHGLIEGSHLEHFGMLSYIAFILAQESVTQEELDTVERLIDQYLELYDTYYGIGRTKLNLHSLKHAVKSVRELGSLWCYTTFNFESWNNKLLKDVTSPKSPILQIITRHLLHMHLEFAISTARDDVSDDVKEQIRVILKKKRRARASFLQEGVYALGSSRPPRQDELDALRRHVTATESILCYDKILLNGAEYQTVSSTSSQGLSDNSVVYTYNKQFFSIKNVVTYRNSSEDTMCGLLVKQKFVLQPPPFHFSPHIQKVLLREAEEHSFIPLSSVRSPVVQVPVSNSVYLIPMPNVLEID